METVRLDNFKKNEYFTPGCLRGRGQKFSVRRNWPHGFRKKKKSQEFEPRCGYSTVYLSKDF